MFLNNKHQFRWSYNNINIVKSALSFQIKWFHETILNQNEPIAKRCLQDSLNERLRVLKEIEEQEANSKLL